MKTILCLIISCFIGTSSFAQNSNDIYLAADFKKSFADCDYSVVPQKIEIKYPHNSDTIIITTTE